MADGWVARSEARLPPGTPRLLLGLILAVAALLRLGALTKPFYIDEIVTITVAMQPLGTMPGVMRQIDGSPALYPLLLHVWMAISHSDAWLRLLSAIFGWLAVAVWGDVASRSFGWRAGLWTTAVLAIAPIHIEYAQYVRNYSLFTLLVGVHVRLLTDWLDPEVEYSRVRLVALAATTAALFYTHYLSALLIVAEGVVLLAYWRRARSRVFSWGAAIALGFVLFLPGVPLLQQTMAVDRSRNLDRPEPPPWTQLVPHVVSELSVGQQSLGFTDLRVRQITLGAAAIVFPGLWLLGTLGARGGRAPAWWLLSVVAWLPLLIYVGSGRRLVAVRFFLPFAMAYLAVVGLGLTRLRPRVAIAAFAVLAMICAVPLAHFYRDYSWSYDHRRVAEAIGQRLQPGDLMLFVHPYEAFYYRWYLGDRVPMQGLVFTALVDQPGYVMKPAAIRLSDAQPRIEAAARQATRLWVVGQSMRSFASDVNEESRVLAWMDQTYRRVDDLGGLTGDDPHILVYAVGGR
jgi:uncharacterized membrane protein